MDNLRLVKFRLYDDDGKEFFEYGYFHRWLIDRHGDVLALIENDDGEVFACGNLKAFFFVDEKNQYLTFLNKSMKDGDVSE